VSFFIAGARGSASRIPPSRSVQVERPCSGWLSIVVAVAMSVGCTLTSDPFDPGIVDTPETDNAPLGPAPGGVSGSGGGAENTGSPTTGGGEGQAPPTRLDPGETDDGELGSVSQPASTGGSRSDAGVEPRDGGGASEPDAGAPSTPSSCSGSTFEGSCYAFFSDLEAWSAAEERCISWGGHLASVESSQEDVLLDDWPLELDVAMGNGTGIWLGGTDTLQNDDFRWPDNSPITLNGWGPNQPDNGPGGADCIEKRNDDTARWYDQRCTDLHPFVCEKPL
jgi:lectin-like protein